MTTQEPKQPEQLDARTFFGKSPGNRITIVGQVVYEQEGDSPVSVGLRTFKRTSEGGESFSRNLRLTNPVDLDFGWVENPGLVIIQNHTGRNPTTNPTEADLKRLARQRLLISLGESTSNQLYVSPGMVTMFEVEEGMVVRLSSASGELKIAYTVLPR